MVDLRNLFCKIIPSFDFLPTYSYSYKEKRILEELISIHYFSETNYGFKKTKHRTTSGASDKDGEKNVG